MSVLVLRTPCPGCGGDGLARVAANQGACLRCNGSGHSEVVLDPTTVIEILTRELYRLHRDRDIDLAHDYRADARSLAEALVRALQGDD